ncbi:hypothetical protein H6802_02765 [Candidatus Nomurabacteria bacterium]|nr:hypothetical protein [Candidatus Nomurabacteria bacterium]MCB9827163.1 hypothetical protein [Candidatus Nomurabacteria bacterium]MCB9827796.1 hypothetical protein [Candidatus Nomurabacteria bacterium]HXK52621.1 hypothetical protein [bacterium]
MSKSVNNTPVLRPEQNDNPTKMASAEIAELTAPRLMSYLKKEGIEHEVRSGKKKNTRYNNAWSEILLREARIKIITNVSTYNKPDETLGQGDGPGKKGLVSTVEIRTVGPNSTDGAVVWHNSLIIADNSHTSVTFVRNGEGEMFMRPGDGVDKVITDKRAQETYLLALLKKSCILKKNKQKHRISAGK